MSQHTPLDPEHTFPKLEERVLARWEERDVFQQSLKRREGATPWVFYEGPPTANGRPGSHHVLSRVFKDIFPRYKTMQGYYVQRKGGWDCHGLPVEIGVEEELGLENKHAIERYGIAEFNAKCRESVFTYLEEWNRLTERIGFWLDLDSAYRTLDNEYIESVWWALKTIHEKGLLYHGNKIVPYCPRCGTALSSHEVALGYKDVVDASIYVRFPVTAGAGPVQPGDQLLVWTTTPWTLPSNVAVALDPDLTYVRARHGEEIVVLAEPLLARVLGEDAEVVEKFSGAEFVGTQYEAPFAFLPAPATHAALRVGAGDFVTAEDGTGLVHIAPPFGEDDYRFGQQHDVLGETTLSAINPVKLDGTYDERMGEFEGRFVKEADQDLIADLQARGRIFKRKDYEHSYPHCWRCDTPLLYYAKPSWYIATQNVRDQLLAGNEQINWHPEHIKEGRFGKWLENNIDWAISRERYWGTPLPVWRCENDHTCVIGSFAELEELSGKSIDDPHRPYVDEITFPCTQCDSTMQRVPEVIDVWFDSGAMPFAQHHVMDIEDPVLKQNFPADFICEALDQTRGWFYSLLAVSTLLKGEPSYKNVVCLGLILDPEGQKMSKSKGNVVDPWSVIDQHGADAFRWYYFTSKQPWDGYRFSLETVGESVRQFLLQLWNIYGFYVLYANVNDVAPQSVDTVTLTELDRWALSRLNATTEEVTKRLDDYDVTFAGRAIQEFVDDLSNWYVRRSRRRFWDGDQAAFATLRHCLLTVSKLLAPFTPFIADEIYDNLAIDGQESVHLCDFPTPQQAGERDEELEFAMAVARETVQLGLAARGQAKLKIRQPLRAAVVVATGKEQAAIEQHSAVVCDELNVKEIRFVSAADELGKYEVKPNYRTLGPRFGKQMPQVAAAVAALNPDSAATTLADGGTVAISINGSDHELGSDDLLLAMQPLDGYQLEREGSHAVALELTLDEELIQEGFAREIIHAVQAARKDAGLEVEDRIELTLGGDEQLLEAARAHQSYISGEVLALKTDFDDSLPETVQIDGKPLAIALQKTNA